MMVVGSVILAFVLGLGVHRLVARWWREFMRDFTAQVIVDVEPFRSEMQKALDAVEKLEEERRLHETLLDLGSACRKLEERQRHQIKINVNKLNEPEIRAEIERLIRETQT